MKTQNLNTIANLFAAYKSTSRTQTFNTIAQKTLEPNFNVRGIWLQYKISYEKFLVELVNADSKLNAIDLYSAEKVEKFISKLQVEAGSCLKLRAALKMDEVAVVQDVITDVVFEEEETESIKTFVPEVVAVPEAKAAVQIETTKPEVKVEKKETKAFFGLNIDLGEMMNEAAKEYLESDAAGILKYVKERIEEEAAKMSPTSIKIGDRPEVIIKGKLHNAFKKALMLTKTEKQLYVAGPAGTGKTTLASQIAEALSVRFGHISCTAGMSEAHLLGRMVADGSYIGSEFVDLYENGGVFLFDEVDASDPNTLLIINSALANGHMSVPNRKDAPRANRHPEFYAICAGNTWGNGSNEYAGRSVLDAAFLDRFAGSKINVDYDTELEKEIAINVPAMAAKLWKIRANVRESRIRRVVSTRAFVSAARQLAAGCTNEEFLEVFFTGWSAEEVAKASK